MKKKLFLKFFVLAVIGTFVTFTSCKDYDDDISKLEKEIAGLSSTLNDLKNKIDAGAVITDVTSTYPPEQLHLFFPKIPMIF